MLSYILLAVIIVSLVSLVGIVTLSWKQKFLRKVLLVIVAFAAGTLLGGAFFDLLPEALEESGLHGEEVHEAGETEPGEKHSITTILLAVIVGILGFFIVERFIFWHHCHHDLHHHAKKKPHSFTYMNLIGDGFHNLLDGAVIAGAFLHSTDIGIITTIAVALHEIPQEIGDFAILLHGGFSKAKALVFNFLSALMAVVGAVIAYFYLTAVETAIPIVLAFTAGGFIYIAVADLFPEIKKEPEWQKGVMPMVALILGVAFMWWLTKVLPHMH